jgi:uncharacterized protein YraI
MSIARSLLGTAIVLSLVRPTALLAQYPYEAVTTARVNVRSGPSENHYTTLRLEPDSHVMVVREESPGWFAIEPPDESFSWVAGEYVREITSTEGEITANDVVVRIGTPFDSRKKDAWQKKLNRGARVLILEKVTSGEAGLAKFHYKIVPPPGEMRYVNSQFLRPVSGTRAAPRNSGGNSNTGTLPPPRDLGTDTPAPASDTSRFESSESRDEEEDDSHAPRGSSRPPRSPIEKANAAYKSMMQKPLGQRDLAAVRALYEQAAQSARSDAEHALIARQLEALQTQEERQSKFMEFEQAVRRSKQRDDALLSIPSRGSKEAPDDEQPQSTSTARYDGSGVLRRSTAVIDGKPAYVLLSPQGGIRYYVTPSPGTDLNKYLDKVVAVRGPSTYRMEVRAQHITVRDVTVIDVHQSGYRDAKSGRGIRRS